MTMDLEPTSHEPVYLRMAELAKILGWPRTNVYYWVKRCDIKVVAIAGHQFIPINDDLPRLIMTLQQAKEAVAKERTSEKEL
jgi:predicted site-specific integrase-resolvase